MWSKFICLTVFQLSVVAISFGQGNWFLVDDLQKNWLVHDGEDYKTFEDSGTNTIYFRLDGEKAKGNYLSISCRQEWSLFVNGKILGSYRSKTKVFDIDSLRLKAQSASLLIGIYKREINPGNLSTTIVSHTDPSQGLQEIERPDSFFRDYVVIALLVLLILFIVVTQLTKLNQAYFSIKRLFSSADSEDTQQYTRIISGTNILLLIFLSLMVSLYLTIVFHFTHDRFDIAWTFNATTFGEALEQWLRLTTILLFAFILKILLIFLMSRMFGLKEILGFQIFSWIRIMMVSLGILCVCLIVFFMSRGMDSTIYQGFFWAIIVVSISWLIILFTRVARRIGCPMFHIISYLCATEIIPLLITVKLIYH